MTAPRDAMIAAVYEAALLPDLWPEALTRLCRGTGFDMAVLFATDGASADWIVTPSGAERLERFFAGGWAGKNERLARMDMRGRHGFVQDYDLFDHDELPTVPIYRDFLIPNGLGLGAATMIESVSEHRVVLSLERSMAAGAVERETIATLDAVRPHLARALVLSADLLRQKLQFTLGIFETLGFAAAILAPDGRMLSANGLLQRLTAQLVFAAGDRLALRDRAAHAQFEKALATLGGDAKAPLRSIALPGSEDVAPAVLHVLPLRGQARDLMLRSSALVFVTTAKSGRSVPGHDVLRSLYDVTTAEARVIGCILDGMDLRRAAETLGVSYETVRGTAKKAFAKTGARGQADLIGRLSFLRAMEL